MNELIMHVPRTWWCIRVENERAFATWRCFEEKSMLNVTLVSGEQIER